MTSEAHTGSAQAALLPAAAPTRAAADSTQRRDRRLRLPIAWVLIVGFGGLVALAVASVLFIGASSNVKNTFTLLHQSGTLRLDTIETHIRDQLDPVEFLGRGLGARDAALRAAPQDEGTTRRRAVSKHEVVGIARPYRMKRERSVSLARSATRSRT